MSDGTPALNESWPYVTEQYKEESEEHIHMKNCAIDWLLEFGFEIGDIEVERRVESPRTYGYTDVCAERDGFELFVECERDIACSRTLSAGGAIPAKEGKLVYFMNGEGLFRVRYTTVTVERTRSPSIVYEEPEEPETFQNTTFKFDRMGAPPSRDGEQYQYSPEAQRREREKVSWL